MKKTLTMILAAALMLTACQTKQTNAPSDNSLPAGSQIESEPITWEDVSQNTEEETSLPETPSVFPLLETGETEIFNQNGIKISAAGFTMEGKYGEPEITLLYENSTEHDIVVTLSDESVNGYMAAFVIDGKAAAGEKSYGSISIMSGDLAAVSIETITDVEFRFHIFDSFSWDTIVSEPIILKAQESDYVQEYDDSGSVLYDDNNIRIISKDFSQNEAKRYKAELYLYVENNSDQGIEVAVPFDAVINGIEVEYDQSLGFLSDTFFWTEVLPGKKTIGLLVIPGDVLQNYGITTIHEMKASFQIYKLGTSDLITETEPFTLTFD